MSDNRTTAISWTNHTWNPTHGCSKVSAGCKNCYAERISYQQFGITDKPWTAENAEDNVRLQEHKLRDPAGVKEPSRIFVNSMSDLFHEQVPDEYIHKVFDVMEEVDRHSYQILTKRPERMAEWERWPDNVWAGTSVEDQRVAHRIETLRDCGAAILFVSFEPLIGPIDTDLDLSHIDWAIVGGESGQDYRPMDHAWARDLRDMCRRDDVAFFFKQSAAYQTEMGIELEEEDGSTTLVQEFPREVRQFAEDTGQVDDQGQGQQSIGDF